MFSVRAVLRVCFAPACLVCACCCIAVATCRQRRAGARAALAAVRLRLPAARAHPSPASGARRVLPAPLMPPNMSAEEFANEDNGLPTCGETPACQVAASSLWCNAVDSVENGASRSCAFAKRLLTPALSDCLRRFWRSWTRRRTRSWACRTWWVSTTPSTRWRTSRRSAT